MYLGGPPQVLLGTGLIYLLALGDNHLRDQTTHGPLGAQQPLTLDRANPISNHEPKFSKRLRWNKMMRIAT